MDRSVAMFPYLYVLRLRAAFIWYMNLLLSQVALFTLVMIHW